jgi:hypothetical protein
MKSQLLRSDLQLLIEHLPNLDAPLIHHQQWIGKQSQQRLFTQQEQRQRLELLRSQRIRSHLSIFFLAKERLCSISQSSKPRKGEGKADSIAKVTQARDMTTRLERPVIANPNSSPMRFPCPYEIFLGKSFL